MIPTKNKPSNSRIDFYQDSTQYFSIPFGQLVNQLQTSQSVANIKLPHHATRLLNQLNQKIPAYAGQGFIPTQPQHTTLPAVITTLPLAGGNVNPQWHLISNLPGYMQQSIRYLGSQVFAALTNIPLEQIAVLANLQGQGPNQLLEMNAVAHYAIMNGQRRIDGEMVFDKYLDDYIAEVKLFDIEQQSFLLVRDFAGDYIYTWSEQQKIEKA